MHSPVILWCLGNLIWFWLNCIDWKWSGKAHLRSRRRHGGPWKRQFCSSHLPTASHNMCDERHEYTRMLNRNVKGALLYYDSKRVYKQIVQRGWSPWVQRSPFLSKRAAPPAKLKNQGKKSRELDGAPAFFCGNGKYPCGHLPMWPLWQSAPDRSQSSLKGVWLTDTQAKNVFWNQYWTFWHQF